MHFFDSKNSSLKRYERMRKDNNYYDHYFSKCGSKLTIDDTPGLIRQISSYDKMKNVYTSSELAKKKFIVLFREPVAAAVSWYKHNIRNCTSHVRNHVTTHEPD